jgi:hypothetical protein
LWDAWQHGLLAAKTNVTTADGDEFTPRISREEVTGVRGAGLDFVLAGQRKRGVSPFF